MSFYWIYDLPNWLLCILIVADHRRARARRALRHPADRQANRRREPQA